MGSLGTRKESNNNRFATMNQADLRLAYQMIQSAISIAGTTDNKIMMQLQAIGARAKELGMTYNDLIGESTTTATSTKTAKFTDDGEVAKDGSVTINYVHISNQATQNFGTQYGQNIEPSGEYMNFISPNQSKISNPNYNYGQIHFKKPLILEWKNTGTTGWKKDLSDMFGGKTGKALSNAVKKAGYDGIITYDIFKGKKSWTEIVNLKGTKL